MPKIGKNVLENLTQGMYKEALIIYREYIQNAADQIDKARGGNAFPNEDFAIEIVIDKDRNRITIADNANGIPRDEVERRLADVADSDKVQGSDKGFRGIGRLGGLAYCRELRFITSYAGEREQTTMIWDAAALKNILNDPDNHADAENILDQIISYKHARCDEAAHFFRVELIGVDNAQLLNSTEVKKYISEVAPLDYSANFDTVSHKIYSFAADTNNQSPPPRENFTLRLHQYNIFVDGERLHRPYSTFIKKINFASKNDEPYDEIRDVHTDLIRTPEGEVVAWIWYGISKIKGAIDQRGYNGLVGLRLRQFNIEIGDRHTLDRFFSETRFNGYFVGEIHTLSRGLIPNARRDYFIANNALNDFEEALGDYAKKFLSPLCRYASNLNSSFAKFDKLKELQFKYAQKQIKGFSSKSEEESLRAEIDRAQKRADEAQKTIDRIKDRAEQYPASPLQKMVRLVLKERHSSQTSISYQAEYSPQSEPNKKNPEPKYLVNELSALSKSERKLISRVYEVIRENMSPELSDELIKKIHTGLGGKA